MSDQTDVLQGTLDDLRRVQQGSLYPALHRLEQQLAGEVSKLERLSAGVNLVLHRT